MMVFMNFAFFMLFVQPVQRFVLLLLWFLVSEASSSYGFLPSSPLSVSFLNAI